MTSSLPAPLPVPNAVCGAIDLGGTKIEARLFDPTLRTVATQRTETPVSDFGAFLEGLAGAIGWLAARSKRAELPIGVCLPGLMNPETGLCFASNIPVSGHDLGTALRKRCPGHRFVFANDAAAFTYSEAHGGAGAGARCVVGLILGTGLSAAVCIDGNLLPRRNGLAVEIGHVGIGGHVLVEAGLPADWPCGCGSRGCVERYVSGSGLAAIAAFLSGAPAPAETVAARAAAGDPVANRALEIWTRLAAEALRALQFAFDPDCIVIGGGLSRLPGLLERLEPALEARLLGHTRAPSLRLARHGDSSGARGMALLALAGAPT